MNNPDLILSSAIQDSGSSGLPIGVRNYLFAPHAGLTLIELLVAISVVSILLLVGVPSYSSFIQEYQLRTDQQRLRSLTSLARTSAVHSGFPSVVCRWDGNTGCSGYSAGGTQRWKGAVLFIDNNANKRLDLPEERVIRVQAFAVDNQISWNNGELLVYKNDGSAIQFGTFSLIRGERQRQLVISEMGRVR